MTMVILVSDPVIKRSESLFKLEYIPALWFEFLYDLLYTPLSQPHRTQFNLNQIRVAVLSFLSRLGSFVRAENKYFNEQKMNSCSYSNDYPQDIIFFCNYLQYENFLKFKYYSYSNTKHLLKLF